MAEKDSLDNLIEGLAGAVVEAQQRIESHQINNFLSYFDEDNRPNKIDVLVPSLHPEHLGEDVRYRVPLLPLVASSLLRIKEVEISFDTDLVGISDQSEKEKKDDGDQSEGFGFGKGKPRSVNLDMRGAGVHRKKAGSVHIVMKVEGQEISEGMARLVDRLIQVQGELGEEG
jgi:hypothetical protein